MLTRYPAGFDLDVTVTPKHRRGRIAWKISAPHRRAATTTGSPTPVGPANGKANITMQLLDDQQVTLGPITGIDDQGNDVALTGTLNVTVDNTAVAGLTDQGDGTFVLATTGQLGTVTVTATDQEPDNADGTAGAQFVGSVAFDVTTSAVVGIEIPVGTPVPRA